MFIYLALMAEAFMGYLLPWGQMSYWGAQVIVSLFGAIPVIGAGLVEWIRGDYFISDITLNRFFAFHVVAVPLALLLLVVVHILALHTTGSLNPDGIEIKEKKGPNGVPLDGVAFHPFHTSKDLVAIIAFADRLCRGPVLRAGDGRVLPGARQLRAGQPAEDAGAHCAGVVLHALLRHPPGRTEQGLGRLPHAARPLSCCSSCPGWTAARSSPYATGAGSSRWPWRALAVSFVALGFLGLQPATEKVYVYAARVFAGIYFAFFLLMPLYTSRERTKPVPERVVYHGHE